MTATSLRTQLLSLALVVMLALVESASSRAWYSDKDIDAPANGLNRAVRSKQPCVQTTQRCEFNSLCCLEDDVCLTGDQTDAHGLSINICVRWYKSKLIYPQLKKGATCTDSWQCADRCCQEHRHYRGMSLTCGKPFDGIDWHTCVTNSP